VILEPVESVIGGLIYSALQLKNCHLKFKKVIIFANFKKKHKNVKNRVKKKAFHGVTNV
jgi:hypothetical protein